MAWKKSIITLESGERIEAQTPEIISASRSTDLPAFYADWFFHRLKVGYSSWTNPFNGKPSYIAYSNTRFIVFWSKNPKPLLQHLPYLKERGIEWYLQYTLNNYVAEGLEPGVAPLQERIDTFKRLVDYGGVGRVIWRFDPLVLTDKIDQNLLLDKIGGIADQLKGYTEKLVFSFADILSYRKVKSNLDANGINYQEWTEPQMLDFANKLRLLNQRYGFRLATCGEKIDLASFDIEHNHCIDDALMIRFAWHDKPLMDFLGVEIKSIAMQPSLFGDEPSLPAEAIQLDACRYAIKRKNNADKGQRQYCGCMVSKDIGQYNTCPHQCEYCYANTSKQSALANFRRHLANSLSETIRVNTGQVRVHI
ncbi:MAG: DUF1848 domain-containing protein [Bacteroidales bacterium]|nr:DUF1848 domain-containing protein [Bacteroidales bacterium]